MSGDNLPDEFFRKLPQEDEDAFVRWAQENNTPAHRAKAGLYHPVIRAAWAVLDALGLTPDGDK